MLRHVAAASGRKISARSYCPSKAHIHQQPVSLSKCLGLHREKLNTAEACAA